MSRSLIDITRDLIVAEQEATIFNSEEAMERVKQFAAERYNKVNGIQYLYGELEGEIALFSRQMDKLKQYLKFLKNSQESVKMYVISQYNDTGELPSHDVFNPIKIRKSPGAVDVVNEDAVPTEYFKEVTTMRLDKKRILEELKAGKEVPGCRLVKNDYMRGVK